VRALVLESPGTLALRQVSLPSSNGACLIRVVRAGICGTDLQMLEGYAEFQGTLGHEFVGVVESVGDRADAAWIGKRVVGEINIGCGRCGLCVTGIKEHCESRSVVGIRTHDGAFADYLALPAANLHEVPGTIDDDAAVFVEPTAAACRILEQVAVEPRARVAVLGDGRMGLLVAQVLRTVTADVTVLGRHDEKLRIAHALGLAARGSEDFSPNACFDIVVDVTGRPDGLRRATELVRPRGTVILKSTFHGESPPLATWPLVVNEVSLVGSRCGPFDRALDLLARNLIDVKPLIAEILPLEKYAMAFAEARRSLKVLFRIENRK
jgi:alcohol dehydrogenase